MRANTWTTIVVTGSAFIGANGCGGSMKAAAPMAMKEAPGAPAMMADRAAPEPAQQQEPQANKQTVAKAGGDQPADAATLNARKQGDWSVVREFAVATYDPADDGPRHDFRETVLWAPAVRTDAEGRATVQFPTSDAITSFRVIAEGLAAGTPGHGEAQIASRLPLSLAANLPVEVTTGDRVVLPVTITNNSAAAVQTSVKATVGGALALNGGARVLWIPARGTRTLNYQLDVRGLDGAGGAGDIELAVTGGKAHDSLKRSLRIVPNGFPSETGFAGTLTEGGARHTLKLPASVVAGSAHTSIKLYPSAVATMTAAVDSIIREPSGCFEQASSSNYPNVMVLSYLNSTGGHQQIAADTTAKLDRGYQLLTGYESKSHGFEWFGGNPGHEALSAYGLMQFREMAKVYPSFDKQLIDRTAAWLRSRRDGKGGYQRNERALDSFGRASPAVTDAYITYALAESGEPGLDLELERARGNARQATDPYVLALSTGAVLAANPRDVDGLAGAARLAKLQAADGHFTGASESITKSGGKALEIETTAFAALALMKAPGFRPQANTAVKWLTEQRSQWGGYGSTQSTVLSLKAITQLAKEAAKPPRGATVAIAINGAVVANTALDATDEAITLTDIGRYLRAGDNAIEIRGSKGVKLEYTLGATWYERSPVSSAAAPVAVTTALDKSIVRVGGGVTLKAMVSNLTDKGQPMTMARVGLPGGLKFQPWQLDELVKRGTVDFVETREREVIIYLRQMKPSETRAVPIQLLAQVPGHYVAPPSSSYLYYTDEHRRYDRPLAVDVLPPPVPVRRRPAATTTTPATTPTTR